MEPKVENGKAAESNGNQEMEKSVPLLEKEEAVSKDNLQKDQKTEDVSEVAKPVLEDRSPKKENLRKRSGSSMSRKSSHSHTNSDSASSPSRKRKRKSSEKRKKRNYSSSSDSSSGSQRKRKRNRDRRTRKRSGSRSNSSKSSSVSSKKELTIYVSNIRKDLDEQYLERKFRKFGTIDGVEIVKERFTSESKGFGFITYVNKDDALRAVKKMNGKELKKRTLTVEMSKRGKKRAKTPGVYMGRGRGG